VDILTEKLNNLQLESENYKRDYKTAIKENSQLRKDCENLSNISNSQELKIKEINSKTPQCNTKCTNCEKTNEKARNEESSHLQAAVKFEEEIKGLKNRLKESFAQQDEQKQGIEKLNFTKTELESRIEKLKYDISNLQDNLILAKDKHLELSIQLQKQLEDMKPTDEKWNTVPTREKSYKGAVAATKDNEDLIANKRTKSIYHLDNIICVQGREDPLSNFYRLETPIKVDDINFYTLEHLFQYHYCIAHKRKDVAIAVANLLDPAEAKDYAKKHIPKADNIWRETQEDIMMNLLNMKLEISPSFRNKLLKSGNKSLLHTVKDAVWGIGLFTAQVIDIGYVRSYQIAGEDKFGLCLENIRELARNTSSNAPPSPQETQDTSRNQTTKAKIPSGDNTQHMTTHKTHPSGTYRTPMYRTHPSGTSMLLQPTKRVMTPAPNSRKTHGKMTKDTITMITMAIAQTIVGNIMQRTTTTATATTLQVLDTSITTATTLRVLDTSIAAAGAGAGVTINLINIS
jgi:ribA/ribD-fused uncharacterized protein